MFENLTGIQEIIKVANRAVNLAERAYTDSGVRQKFGETGRVSLAFQVGKYLLKIEVLDTENQAVEE